MKSLCLEVVVSSRMDYATLYEVVQGFGKFKRGERHYAGGFQQCEVNFTYEGDRTMQELKDAIGKSLDEEGVSFHGLNMYEISCGEIEERNQKTLDTIRGINRQE